MTENGKLFVREIERLRNELNDVQLVRRHLVEESNEMQKKLNFEGNTIPRLEKELKTLSEENNYLKLLCKYIIYYNSAYFYGMIKKLYFCSRTAVHFE